MQEFTPTNEIELGEILRAEPKTRLRIKGGGTRQALGNPVERDAVLNMTALSGIRLYEPGALHMVVLAGTPLAEIESVLRDQGQMLAFEPMDHRALLRTTGEPTVGGMVACGVSGSRRVLVGGCRDHLLGVRFVTGHGEVIKSGGRVMKNVTGLDLAKLQCGALGSMGVLCELSLKTMPLPEVSQTLMIPHILPEGAVKLFMQALNSPFEVSGAAYISRGVYLRIEGLAVQVRHRSAQLQKILACDGMQLLQGEDSDNLWRSHRDVLHFADSDKALWRVGVRPSKAAALSHGLRGLAISAKVSWDLGGGRVWVAADAHFGKKIQQVAEAHGAHCTLVRAGEGQTGDVFPTQQPRLLQIAQGLREQFDPEQRLNPSIFGVG